MALILVSVLILTKNKKYPKKQQFINRFSIRCRSYRSFKSQACNQREISADVHASAGVALFACSKLVSLSHGCCTVVCWCFRVSWHCPSIYRVVGYIVVSPHPVPCWNLRLGHHEEHGLLNIFWTLKSTSSKGTRLLTMGPRELWGGFSDCGQSHPWHSVCFCIKSNENTDNVAICYWWLVSFGT